MKKLIAMLMCLLMLLGTACAQSSETQENTLAAADTKLNAQSVEAALTVLDDADYTAAWEAISTGETVVKGSKGSAAKGLQKLLKALGSNIYVDGNAGTKTFAALNEQRAAFGAAETDAVDEACFARLVLWLRVTEDSGNAQTLIDKAGFDAGEAQYWLACVDLAAGRGYSAAKRFTDCEWSDGAAKAESCAQEWPADGEIYRAEDATDRDVQLVLVIKDQPTDEATLAKLYHGGECISMVFIGEEGRASVRLPAGHYSIHLGTGEKWYGTVDAFGEDAQYEAMLFDGSNQVVTFEAGMKYTLTLNDDGDTNVGSAVLNLDNF